MIKFKKILFPTSLSPSESPALDYAISLALQHEAALYLVHVVEDHDFNSPGVLSYFPGVVESKGGYQGGDDQAMKLLHNVISPQLGRQMAVEEVLAKGKPYEEILRVAKEKYVDLLVIPSHRAPGCRQRHLGSTAEQVVGSAPCPVLVIRQTTSVIAGGETPTTFLASVPKYDFCA